MKDYKEMADSLFARREEYYAERKQKMRTIRGATSGLSLAGVALLLGAVIWNSGSSQDTDATPGIVPVELQGMPTDTSGIDAIGQESENPQHQKNLSESENSLPYTDIPSIQDNTGIIDSYSNKQESASSDGLGNASNILPEKNSSAESAGISEGQQSSLPVEDIPVAEQSPGHLQAVTVSGNLSDCFGGSYTNEQGQFVILLTVDTPQNRSALCSQLGISETAVSFIPASYTLAYLTELQSRISDGMINKELPFVAVSSVREDLNRIHVLVTSGNEADLAKLKALDTLSGALEIEYATENAQPEKLIGDLALPHLE